MLSKIRDFFDSKVYMAILVDDVKDLCIVKGVISAIGKERVNYNIYKEISDICIVEISMPYNRYLALMRGLQRNGYNLRQETDVGYINRLIKQ